jgi:hypothetical protein
LRTFYRQRKRTGTVEKNKYKRQISTAK